MSSSALGSVVSRMAGASNCQSIVLRGGPLKDFINRGKIVENVSNFTKRCFVRVGSTLSVSANAGRHKDGENEFENFVVRLIMKRLKLCYGAANNQYHLLQFDHRCLSTAVKGEEAVNLKVKEKSASSTASPTSQTSAQAASPAVSKKFEISYEDLLSFVRLEEKFLFDVREPKEIQDTGSLPHAINIPLTQLKASLQLDESEFTARFHIRKPSPTDSHLMVFYGLSSVKGMSALEIAHKLGFKK
ncbi:hypothetical protein HELRODRAFT_107973 [Helobdella robusta]|uniref:Rhodanese domain-containing protein n=1 Tax=Helobdella robusta TaxID=6412 RepID=T1EEE5_HELRO|nr:hypothetical protein HELRODRAFT_107973 [Helobdella robusta]ESN92567.1 hypothetical protein HELRODRAFT_107973 [Helobdella robusta]